MRRRTVIAALLALVAPHARSQSARPLPKIGVIRWDREQLEAIRRTLPRALEAHGYVEGKSIAMLFRSAEESHQRADEIVREFVAQRVSVIVAAPTPAAHAARRGTSTIPIVLSGVADPVASGLVTNIARPGGNVTGVSLNLPAVAGKRVELLHDAFPSFKRIAFLGSSTDAATPTFIANTEQAAKRFGLTIHVEQVAGSAEFDGALARIAGAGAQAIIIQPIFWTHAKRLGELAIKYRLPTVSDFDSFAREGGLFSYGPDRSASLQIVADYIDKILKGTKPGDLPIQEPTRFALVVNLRTAKALGVTIPAFVLDRADEAIR